MLASETSPVVSYRVGNVEAILHRVVTDEFAGPWLVNVHVTADGEHHILLLEPVEARHLRDALTLLFSPEGS